MDHCCKRVHDVYFGYLQCAVLCSAKTGVFCLQIHYWTYDFLKERASTLVSDVESPQLTCSSWLSHLITLLFKLNLSRVTMLRASGISRCVIVLECCTTATAIYVTTRFVTNFAKTRRRSVTLCYVDGCGVWTTVQNTRGHVSKFTL